MMPATVTAQEKAKIPLEAFAPNTWWLARTEKFYFRDPDGLFVEYSERILKMKLRQRGIFINLESSAASELKRFQDWLWGVFIDGITTKHVIRWAGELAGWQPGIYLLNGHQIIIDKGPDLIDVSPGKFDDLEQFFQEFFQEGQVDYFKAWVKNFARQIYELKKPKDFRPTQALFIGGEVDIGKSFIGKTLLALMFGGRQSNAENALLNVGTFNASVSRCELGVCDDLPISRRFNKEEYSTLLKQWAAGNQAQIRVKFKDEVEARLLRALVVIFNTKSASMVQLPNDGDDINDKLIALVGTRTSFALHLPSVAKKLISQVGPWLGNLLDHYEIPEAIRYPGRYGILPYRHPELEAAQKEGTDLELVERLIASIQREKEKLEFTTYGILLEMEKQAEMIGGKDRIKKISVTALGIYLHILAKEEKSCVQFLGRERRNGHQKRSWWAILPLSATSAPQGAPEDKGHGHNDIR